MAKNKNRKQAGEQDRGHEQAAERGAERMGSAEPSPSTGPAQFAGGAKRQKKFGHN
ncbi:hypothetical protein [Streptomyces sp. 2A115]|uniref:hypothetical protein n=1 Tax=Streptomyces sp. 2A115 TaxID=3457439 RepID=UPI003FD4929E